MLSACGGPIESQTQTTADELRASSSRVSPRSSICDRRRGACVEVRIGRNSTVHASATQAFEYLLEYRLAGGDLRDTVIVEGARLGRAESLVANDFHSQVMEHTFSDNDWQNDTNIIDSLLPEYNDRLRFDASIFHGTSTKEILAALEELRQLAMSQSTQMEAATATLLVGATLATIQLAKWAYDEYKASNPGKYDDNGDFDGDGVPNHADWDIDGDGIPNDDDEDPWSPAQVEIEFEDTGDGEGITAESEGRMRMIEFIYNSARDYQTMMRGYGY